MSPAVLPACLASNVRFVTNMGAADPSARARTMRRLARQMGERVACAGVTGDPWGDYGVTRSLRRYMHGKSLSSSMLTTELPGHPEDGPHVSGLPCPRYRHARGRTTPTGASQWPR